MLSSDRPIYKPGDVIRLRSLALRSLDLKPIAGKDVVFTVTDPKDNVIFKRSDLTSKFGISSADCALADEIIEGVLHRPVPGRRHVEQPEGQGGKVRAAGVQDCRRFRQAVVRAGRADRRARCGPATFTANP